MRRIVIFGLLFLLAAAMLCARTRRHPRVLTMKATAYSRAPQPTAAGTGSHVGMVAADPAVLPLGTRIRVSGAGPDDGVYLVTDTGPAINGREIDIYIPNTRRAKEFGVKRVRVTILSLGHGPQHARKEARRALPTGELGPAPQSVGEAAREQR